MMMMMMMMMTDPRYVEARRVLLDALDALRPHRNAIIIAGAQAIYLHTGEGDLAIAPFTTDGDLALDPTLLDDTPELEAVMRAAGFTLLEPRPGSEEPGIWVAKARIEEVDVLVQVDLIVPEGVAPPGGRRGARLGPHGNRAARRAIGLEAALVDHAPMRLRALDPADLREIDAEVAGPAAMIVAKMHKIHDRVERPDRLVDKDAADVFRLMSTVQPDDIAMTMRRLIEHETAGPPTQQGLDYLRDLFGSRSGDGINMAGRALRIAMPEERVLEVCLAWTEALLSAI